MRAALAAEGFSTEDTSDGLALRSRTLRDELLVPHRASRSRPWRQARSASSRRPMNEVFRRLILEAQEARAQEAA